MIVTETERLIIRELDSNTDAAFVFELLNTPKFLQYIGDRGVRTVDEARDFIEKRYRQSYRDHGYGLYAVGLEPPEAGTIGMCGFVRREFLDGPDLGFAFLPDFEGKGYGIESARAMMQYGRSTLGFDSILAITSLDNSASIRLLTKLGFRWREVIEQNGEQLNLFVHSAAANSL